MAAEVASVPVFPKRTFSAQGMTAISFDFLIRNKNKLSRHFSVMMGGYNKDDVLLWTLNAEPIISTKEAVDSDQTVSSHSYVPPGTLKETTKVWIRIVGDL